MRKYFGALLVIVMHFHLVNSGGVCENSKLIQRFSDTELPILGKFVLPVTPSTAGFHKIIVKGKLHGFDIFHINLLTGPSFDNDDIAFHLRVDSSNRLFHSSSKKDDIWFQAVNMNQGLAADSSFEIAISITRRFYKVFLNDSLVMNYAHVIHPEEITYVHLYVNPGHQVDIQSVERELPDVSFFNGIP